MTEYRGDRLDLEVFEVERLDVRIVGGEVNVTASNEPPGGAVRVEVDVERGPDVVVALDAAGTLTVVHQPGPNLLATFAFGARAGAWTRPRVGEWRGGGWTGSIGASCSVSVVVPEATATAIRTVGADAFVGGVTAGTSVTTVSRRVTATGLAGATALRSVSGDLEVQGLRGTLHVNTVSGDLTVGGGDPEEVRARTVSGDLTFDLDEVPDVDCTSVSGDVAVRLPSGAAADLDLVTVSGRLETSFPDRDLEGGRRRLRGRIGDGGPRLTVRTTSGDVVVLRRHDAPAAAAGGDR